jgi:hypothetical protein
MSIHPMQGVSLGGVKGNRASGAWALEIAMKPKSLIMIGLVVGSTAGSYLPMLWGAGWLSIASVLFGGIGGLLGIWAGYKVSRL